MPLNDDLQKHIASLAGPEAWEAGLKLFLDNAVLEAQHTPKSIIVRLANDRGRFEQVSVAIRANQLVCRCTCRTPSPYCAHKVAALLIIAKESPERLDPVFNNTSEEAQPPTQEAAGVKLAAMKSSVSELTMDALKHFLQTSEADARLNLVCKESPFPSLELPSQKLEIAANIEFRGVRYAQGNIKRLIETGRAAGGMTIANFDPQIQQVMNFIVRFADMSNDSFTLTTELVADLFHCLRGSRMLTTGSGAQVYIHLSPLQIAFCTQQTDGTPSIIPKIMIPDQGVLEPEQLSFIAGRGGYWIGRNLEYWWFPGILPLNWLRLFIQGPELKLDPAELERLDKLCAASRFPGKIVSNKNLTELYAEYGKLKPVLTLDWDKQGLVGDLEFDYNGTRTNVGGNPMLMSNGHFIRRDLEYEDTAINLLREVGFESPDDSWKGIRLKDPEKIWQFMKSTSRFLAPHWLVFWTPQVRTNMAATSEARLAISAGHETEDWFETTCLLKAADGTPVPFADALEAVSNDRDIVKLPSGAIVKLPATLLNLIKNLVQKAVERNEEGTLKFQHCQALTLSDELDDYWEGPKPQWQELKYRILNHRKIKLPPISPSLKRTLRPYQTDGLKWLHTLEECGFNGILADEMGLGKTIQALALILSRKMLGQSVRPSLVVCPTSLLDNWAIEAKRFTPQLKTMVIKGNDRAKELREMEHADLIITSYALLRRDGFEYEGMEFDHLILDEAQHIKNPKTANAKTCKGLRAEYKLILTGTPIENNLIEIWSLFDFLLPGYLGTNRNFHLSPKATEAEKEERQTAIAAQIKPFILRRTKVDVCAELPPKLEQVLFCELTEQQRTIYDNLMLAGRRLLDFARKTGWKQHRFDVLAMLLRLRQTCCHPILLPKDLRSDFPDDIPSAKFDLAKEVILEAIDSRHRILLFSQFTSVLDLFPEWLKKSHIKFERLDGSTQDRQAHVDKFNNSDDIPIFLLSLKAGGTGLNLTGADTVIHFDQWWNPMVEDQATDRAHRIGQTRTVTSIKLIAQNTVEEKILALQDSKRNLFHKIVDDAPASLDDLTTDDIEYIFAQ